MDDRTDKINGTIGADAQYENDDAREKIDCLGAIAGNGKIRFARVPPRAAAARLTGRGYAVLIAICRHASKITGRAYASLDTIAEAVGIDRSKVPDRIKEIEAAMLLRVTRRPGRSSFYEILFDDPAVLPSTATHCSLPRQHTVPFHG
jgi:hypothetical protein